MKRYLAPAKQYFAPAKRYLAALALLVASQFSGASAQSRPSLDAAQYISAEDARLGSRPGEIVLRETSELTRSVTLGAGHSLLIAAPLHVDRASITLRGNNSVRCAGALATSLTAAHTAALFTSLDAQGIAIDGCRVTGAEAAGYLLQAVGTSHIRLTGNDLTGVSLLQTPGSAAHPCTDITISGNKILWPKGNGPIGVYLIFVQHATVTNNRFQGTAHAIEWWGGDANGGWRSPADAGNTGHMVITGNVCDHAGGACVWGSLGSDITVTGNQADGCGDVCFDVEGGTRTVFTANHARDCANGCYAVEFESQDITFTGNFGESAGGAVVLVKHGPGNPFSHVRLSVTGNTFTCTRSCPALYTEGEDGLDFSHNTITNGVLQAVNYHNDVRIVGNAIRFTVPIGSLPAIGVPTLFHGRTSTVEDNQVLTTAQADPQAACIAQGWADNNDTDTMNIRHNTCNGFPVGIVTTTNGGNPGAPAAVWNINGNVVTGALPDQAFLHRRISGNDRYTRTPDNTTR